MIKAILFDIGGVLLRTETQSPRQKWESMLGLANGGAEALVLNSEMGHKAQRGEITTDELWQWVGAQHGLPLDTLNTFRDDFWSGDVLDQELVALIRRLHKRYQTAVISNYSDMLPNLLINEFGLGDAFDHIVVSSTVGVMKPHPKIYQTALDKLGLPPEETVFIDDFAHNIDGANALGIHGIHFTPNTNLVAELEKVGVEIPPV